MGHKLCDDDKKEENKYTKNIPAVDRFVANDLSVRHLGMGWIMEPLIKRLTMFARWRNSQRGGASLLFVQIFQKWDPPLLAVQDWKSSTISWPFVMSLEYFVSEFYIFCGIFINSCKREQTSFIWFRWKNVWNYIGAIRIHKKKQIVEDRPILVF